QARAAVNGIELPPHVEAAPVVLEHVGSLGSRHSCFSHVRRGRSHRREHRRSDGPEIPVSIERRPFTELLGISERLPDRWRRVTEFADKHERPLLTFFLDLSAKGPPGRVLLTAAHVFSFLSQTSPSPSGPDGAR